MIEDKTYITSEDGIHSVEFQFGPTEIKTVDEGNYKSDVLVGHTEPDILWLNTKAKTFEIDLIIDRTNESLTNPKAAAKDYVNMPRGGNMPNWMKDFIPSPLKIVGGNVSSRALGIWDGMKKAYYKYGKYFGVDSPVFEFPQTEYSYNPTFEQFSETGSEYIGVYYDMDQIRAMIYPEGYSTYAEIGDGRNPNGRNLDTKSIVTNENLFVAPVPVYFIHGSMWKYGYLSKAEMIASVMSSKMVPRRLNAKVTMLILAEGTFAVNMPPAQRANLKGVGRAKFEYSSPFS